MAETVPKRGEEYALDGQTVFVTYAKRSESPDCRGGCKTTDLTGGFVDDRGWYVEYRTATEGPLLDANTPGLHRTFVAD